MSRIPTKQLKTITLAIYVMKRMLQDKSRKHQQANHNFAHDLSPQNLESTPIRGDVE